MATTPTGNRPQIKQPHNLSTRIAGLRDFYFQGVEREWNNEFLAWTTGTEITSATSAAAIPDRSAARAARSEFPSVIVSPPKYVITDPGRPCEHRPPPPGGPKVRRRRAGRNSGR